MFMEEKHNNTLLRNSNNKTIFDKKYFLINFHLPLLIFSTLNSFGQNIGLASNFNTSLKHAHLTGTWNYKVESIDDLNYDISKYVDSLFLEKKVIPVKTNDFDFKILSYYVPSNTNKSIAAKLFEYCDKKNLDAIIIFYKNNYYPSLSPFKNMYYDDIDYGILSYKHAEYRLFYYTNVSFIYYIKKTNKLEIPNVKIDDPNYFNGKMIKNDSITFDKNLKLNNAQEKIKQFLPIYKNLFKSYVFKILEEIHKNS